MDRKKFQTNLSQPDEKNSASFSVPNRKMHSKNFLFSASIFVPLYGLHRMDWMYGPQNLCPGKKILENRTQKYASKIMSPVLKTVLYGPTINVVVLSSIFVPSLLLSFPSICVLQNFSFAQEKWKLSLFSLSALSSHFNLQKWGKMPFPCLFEKTLGWV